MKKVIKDYFTFSRKERIAIMALLLLIAVFVALPWLYTGGPAPPVPNPALEAYIAASTVRPRSDSGMRTDVAAGNDAREPVTKEGFPFDPNTITVGEWQRLGITARTARTILNYRSKGGVFRRADDIRKIWGIRKDDADRLLPFVRIAGREPAGGLVQRAVPVSTIPQKKIAPIDINTAGEDQWKSLPGIGEVLARRILKFREVAGGFTGVQQVAQTYGLADSVFRRIEPLLETNEATLPKWNLNLLNAFELRRRLAIDETTAKAIVASRRKDGNFPSVEALRSRSIVSDTLWQRISRFLKTE